VSATIGRDDAVDFVVRNRRPYAVHFNFVVVANHATLGRAQLAAFAGQASARPMMRIERIGALTLICAALLAALLILQYLMR
jgi:hypothetical protein